MSQPIFTNKALKIMAEYGLSEGEVVGVFNSGTVEKWTNGVGYNSIKKFFGYEMGVAWFRDQQGVYRITSVWKRKRR